ncbi:DUF3156 family protein [Pseudomonas sp. R5(2019)]|uniref:DUF3156 family protein n=1 Tax=Pseudomonas sp. R5(2019) TaxID=2697566 RepID=UPI001413370A|nr:DUF3156 family protein [Pseudomonas sp. R5(2019)]NBA97130.1 DUF3156 family protein [Pseudomonas sp. R5(2019)]
MLRKLSEFMCAQRAPAGYRPGATLEHLRRNLGLAGFQMMEPGRARLLYEDGELAFEIHERTESQWLMHLVMTEFVLRIPASQQGSARLEVHHGGAIRRSGLVCRRRAGDKAIVTALDEHLQADSALLATLLPLDFKRLHIELADGCWTLRLEHMGGSEVVNKMPAFRRYIRLNPDQRKCLLDSLEGVKRLLLRL